MLLNKIFLAYIWSRYLEDTCKILFRVLTLEVFMEFWISELTLEKDWKLRDRMWQTIWWKGNGIWEGHERAENALEMWSWLTWVGEWAMLGIKRKRWRISDVYGWKNPEQDSCESIVCSRECEELSWTLWEEKKNVWSEHSSLSFKEK